MSLDLALRKTSSLSVISSLQSVVGVGRYDLDLLLSHGPSSSGFTFVGPELEISVVKPEGMAE